MVILEYKFNKTISDYNENVSDLHKFKFSDKEKAMFLNMIREYAEECVKASLERACKDAIVDYENKVVEESIDNNENIILL